jgi:hypothetical protein
MTFDALEIGNVGKKNQTKFIDVEMKHRYIRIKQNGIEQKIGRYPISLSMVRENI